MTGERSRPMRRIIVRLGLFIAALPTLVILIYGVVGPPITPLMIIRAIEGEEIHRTWRPLEAIAPELRLAVIAAEDARFCQHHGFDTEALNREMDAWLDGGRPRGASTITMQTAKNILLWPGRDLLRKAIEAWMTPQIELLWSKRRILEVYLNVIEFGPGIYGAEAAARRFFGRPASQLDRRQAALLAAVLPNPRLRSAGRPTPMVLRRAVMIERRSAQLGALADCAAT